MKIFRNHKVYVQNKDLSKIMYASIHYREGIPQEVISKAFTGSFKVTPENMDEYTTFEDNDSIRFFKRMPYIIDYDKIRKLSENEIISIIKATMDRISYICSSLNRKRGPKKLSEYYEALDKIDLLEHKFFALRTILWERQGTFKNVLPYELTDAYRLRMAFNRRRNTVSQNNY